MITLWDAFINRILLVILYTLQQNTRFTSLHPNQRVSTMGKGRTFQGAVAMSSGQQSARGYSRADSLGGESTKSSKSSKSTTSPKETFGKDALVYFAKRAGILSVSIGVGVLYTTQR